MSSKRKSFSQPQEAQQFWHMVFETFEASRLSVKQFCQKEGLAEWAFYHWKKKLRPSPSETAVGKKNIAPSRDVPANTSSPFVPVAQILTASAAMRIEFPSGICLQISNGCDQQLLHNALVCLRC